jgi:hypothetical protein
MALLTFFSSALVLAVNNWHSIVVGWQRQVKLPTAAPYHENLLTLFQLCPGAGSEQLAVNSGRAGSSE